MSSPTNVASSSSGQRRFVDDPRFKQGLLLVKDKKYDEALEFWDPIMATIAEMDELSLEAAPVQFAYGDCLLRKVEDSGDLFGEAVSKSAGSGCNVLTAEDKNDGSQEGEQEEEQEEEEGGEGEEEGGDGNEVEQNGESSSAAVVQDGADDGTTKVAIPEEVQDDLEVAWENLETARLIYAKNLNETTRDKLAEVHLRLGDLLMLNGKHSDAVDDYKKSKELYEQTRSSDDRVLAEIHHQLATAYLYASSSTENKKAIRDLKEQSLQHFIQCADIFEHRIRRIKDQQANGGGAQPAGDSNGKGRAVPEPITDDLNDLTEILQELQETIEASKQELDQMCKLEPVQAAGASSGSSTTTIGFGAAGQSSSSQAGGGATVMAVKKKVKPTTMVGEGAVGEKRPADVLAKAGGEESGQPLAKQSRAE